MTQQYFLISKTDAFRVRQVLEEAIASYPKMSLQRFKDALHDLDAGLNVTDDVPSDYRDDHPSLLDEPEPSEDDVTALRFDVD